MTEPREDINFPDYAIVAEGYINKKMRNTPVLYEADDIKEYDVYTEVDGCWYLTRPIYCMSSIFYRLKIAYYVFTGKYDALKWNG